jgi:uncharacterized membrane-anchored protein YjiN (DUF445 family)
MNNRIRALTDELDELREKVVQLICEKRRKEHPTEEMDAVVAIWKELLKQREAEIHEAVLQEKAHDYPAGNRMAFLELVAQQSADWNALRDASPFVDFLQDPSNMETLPAAEYASQFNKLQQDYEAAVAEHRELYQKAFNALRSES